MDPVTVFRTLWHFKWVALPIIIMTALASLYIYESDRSFVADSSYAFISPQLPTERQIELNPSIGQVNRDNPYLRSSEGLLSQVLVAKLGEKAVADELKSSGLSDSYTVSAVPAPSGADVMIKIEASGKSVREAVDTANALGDRLRTTLHDVQKVNGADDSVLFRAQTITSADSAQEAFTSRLRSIIVLTVAALIVLFASVSVARMVETKRGMPIEDDESRDSVDKGVTSNESEAEEAVRARHAVRRRRLRPSEPGANDVDLDIEGNNRARWGRG